MLNDSSVRKMLQTNTNHSEAPNGYAKTTIYYPANKPPPFTQTVNGVKRYELVPNGIVYISDEELPESSPPTNPTIQTPTNPSNNNTQASDTTKSSNKNDPSFKIGKKTTKQSSSDEEKSTQPSTKQPSSKSSSGEEESTQPSPNSKKTTKQSSSDNIESNEEECTPKEMSDNSKKGKSSSNEEQSTSKSSSDEEKSTQPSTKQPSSKSSSDEEESTQSPSNMNDPSLTKIRRVSRKKTIKQSTKQSSSDNIESSSDEKKSTQPSTKQPSSKSSSDEEESTQPSPNSKKRKIKTKKDTKKKRTKSETVADYLKSKLAQSKSLGYDLSGFIIFKLLAYNVDNNNNFLKSVINGNADKLEISINEIEKDFLIKQNLINTWIFRIVEIDKTISLNDLKKQLATQLDTQLDTQRDLTKRLVKGCIFYYYPSLIFNTQPLNINKIGESLKNLKKYLKEIEDANDMAILEYKMDDIWKDISETLETNNTEYFETHSYIHNEENKCYDCLGEINLNDNERRVCYYCNNSIHDCCNSDGECEVIRLDQHSYRVCKDCVDN